MTPLPSYGSFSITWTEPANNVAGYELEVRVAEGSFQKVGTNNIPQGIKIVNVYINASLPELTPIAFRLRSVFGTEFSGYSNEAATKLPIKSSYLSAYFDPKLNAMSLYWSNDSVLATTVKVEKATLTLAQPGTYAVLYNGPVSTLKVLDPDLKEDTSYRYRISFLAQGESSAYQTTDTTAIPLLAPKIISSESNANGVTIRWQGVSSKAMEIKIQRGTGFDYPSYTTIASLPLGTTQYVDSAVSSGFYSYRVVVTASGQSAYSAPVSLVTAPIGTGVAFSSSLKTLPWMIRAMCVWSDAPATLTAGADSFSYVLTPPSGAAWPTHTIYNVSVVHETGFTLDGQGRPHFLFRRTLGGAPVQQAVIHEWYNGTTWLSDELFRGSFSDSSGWAGIRYAVAQDGIVHAIWQPSDTPGYSVWYGTNRSGSWEAVQLQPNGGISNLGSYRLAVDQYGTAYAALGLWNKVVLFTRSSGVSTFAQEEVPTGTINAGWYDTLEIQPFGGKLAFFFERTITSPTFSYSEMSLIKDQGVWGQPVQLASSPNTGDSTVSKASASMNGRLAYAVTMPEGLRVFTLAPNLTWDSTVLAPSSGYSPIWLGFNNQNKLWCAVSGGWGPESDTEIYAWYAE